MPKSLKKCFKCGTPSRQLGYQAIEDGTYPVFGHSEAQAEKLGTLDMEKGICKTCWNILNDPNKVKQHVKARYAMKQQEESEVRRLMKKDDDGIPHWSKVLSGRINREGWDVDEK